jgi:hypothetical protein
MELALFAKTYPRLFHMAHHEALPSIRRHGLLSTSALLDLFEISGERRLIIETQMRSGSVLIEHPVHGKAVIRDQKAIMNDRRLEKALGGSMQTKEFHRLLNSMVFFWVSPDRLKTLREAVAYHSEPQLVIILDTKRLVEVCAEQMMLCPMNSGSCKPMAHPRTPAIFQPIDQYDFDLWKKKKGSAAKAVVECTVTPGIFDVDRFIIEHEIVG